MNWDEMRQLEIKIAELLGWTDVIRQSVPAYATFAGREDYVLGIPPVGPRQDVPRYVTSPDGQGAVVEAIVQRFGKLRVDVSRAASTWWIDVQVGTVVRGRLLWYPVCAERTQDNDGDRVLTHGIALGKALLAASEPDAKPLAR